MTFLYNGTSLVRTTGDVVTMLPHRKGGLEISNLARGQCTYTYLRA